MLTVRKGNTNTHNYLLFMSGLHTGHTHIQNIKQSKSQNDFTFVAVHHASDLGSNPGRR